MKRLLALFHTLAIGMLLAGLTARGDTIRVPADYPTIQEAIFAAADGDTVLVADGTYIGPYNRGIDFIGKAITVQSENGPEQCVIDCYAQDRGFVFRFGEGPDSVLDGFKITGGYTTEYGAGIYVYGSSPTIRNCVIAGNYSANYGGGVYCSNGSNPEFIDCVIRANVCADGSGGGVYSTQSSPTFTDCVIGWNVANYYSGAGGGLYISGTSATRVTLRNCQIAGNRAGSAGGGIYCYNARVDAVNCTVVGNESTYVGGGGVGGGLYVSDPSSTLHSTLTGCTIVGNSASSRGGGLAANSSYTRPILRNCILWANDAPTGPQVALSGSADLDVSYSDVQGGLAEISLESGCTVNWGAGNIVANPQFVDPNGPDDDPDTWEDNDYHLSASSPCIDAGEPGAYTGQTDIDGQVRVRDGDGNGQAVVDIGSDEYGSFLPGDMNCDNLLNGADIPLFVMAFTDPAGYAAAYPNCDIMNGDCNQDGLFNVADIPAFVELLTGG